MIILGIDPGSRKTGYGIIQKIGKQNIYIASGCIDISSYVSFAARLDSLFVNINKVIDMYKPSVLSIEKIFVAKNADSALKLGQARGIVLLVAHQRQLTINEYTARQVKQIITGNGNADKNDIQACVKDIFKLSQTPQSDAADALAIALCHSFSLQILKTTL